MTDVTCILSAIEQGDTLAAEQLLPHFKPAGADMQLLPETSKTVFGGRAWDVNDSG